MYFIDYFLFFDNNIKYLNGVVENTNKMLGILAKAVVEKRFDKNLIKKFEEYGKISDLSLKNPKKYHAQKLKIETDILKKNK